jgi:hypothetical protein
LPGDRPHVGPYQTYFTELFAGRPTPPRGQCIDRTLPVRRRSIDNRAEAVRAGEAALAAAEESYRAGRADLEAVLSSMGELGRQQRLLVASVCDYNDEIADYVISVVARPSDLATLVKMMIKPSRPIAQAIVPGMVSGNKPTLAPREGVRPAGNSESAAGAGQPPVLPLVDPRLPAIPQGSVSPREPSRLDNTPIAPKMSPIQGLGKPGAAARSGAAPQFPRAEAPASATLPADPTEPTSPEPEAPKLPVIPVEPGP